MIVLANSCEGKRNMIRKTLLIAALAWVAALGLGLPVAAQEIPVFSPHEGNPVLNVPDGWMVRRVVQHSAEEFRLFLFNQDGDLNHYLGRSSNGMAWDLDLDHPLLGWSQSPAGYDFDMTEIKEGGTYRAWFSSGFVKSGSEVYTGGQLSAAQSSDPLAYHDKELQMSDRSYFYNPFVVQAGGVYRLYYLAYLSGQFCIACATSIQGQDWYPQGAVLCAGQSDAFDGKLAYRPVVLYREGLYEMFYTGLDQGDRASIGYAISADGESWQKKAHLNYLGEAWLVGASRMGDFYRLWYRQDGNLHLATAQTSQDGDNQPPSAEIRSPQDGTVFQLEDNITFHGRGQDPEDGELSGASLVWTRDGGQPMATGNTFTINTLSVGFHEITLTVSDSRGALASASITIEVQERIKTVSH